MPADALRVVDVPAPSPGPDGGRLSDASLREQDAEGLLDVPASCGSEQDGTAVWRSAYPVELDEPAEQAAPVSAGKMMALL
jgi:hypothetical protein